jgi:integrase
MEVAKVHAGVWEDPRRGQEDFATFASKYLKGRMNNGEGLSPKGKADLEGCLRNHLAPFFGQTSVRDITREQIQEWVSDWMPGKKSSPQITAKALRYLKAVLQEAYERELINRNYAKKIEVKLSGRPRKQKFVLTPEELLRLAEAITPRYRAMILLAGFVGLRAAECAGLRYEDLHLDEGFALISVTNSEVGGILYLEIDTKTRQVAPVPLAPWLCRLLESHIAEFPSSDGFVFTSPQGNPLRYRNFSSRQFKPALAQTGIDEQFEFRWLRDTAASNARHLAHQSTKVIQRMLRHASESMTSHYTQLPSGDFDDLKSEHQLMFEKIAAETGSEFAARLLPEAN